MARVVPTDIVALIDQNLPESKSQNVGVNHGTGASLTAIARLIDELPTELLTINGKDYSDLVCGVEAIRNAVAFWQSSGAGNITIAGIRGKNVLLLIREALAKCPDQSPSPSTAELTFIIDSDLRNSIRLDLGTATSALHNGEWKAATVLAGSAAEALLYWKISNSPDLANLPNKPRGQPDSWGLGDYVSVAVSLNLIREATAQQTTLAKNFRNLIHPGRAQHRGEICDKGTALTALAAVELIVRDFNR